MNNFHKFLQIVSNLGQHKVRESFSSTTDVKQLLGQHAIEIPHSM